MKKESKDTIDFFGTQILAVLIISGFFIILGYLIFKEKWDIVGPIIGALVSAFLLIVGYKWGSSQGSKDKTDAMNQKLNQ
jgi:hypothetical protein